MPKYSWPIKYKTEMFFSTDKNILSKVICVIVRRSENYITFRYIFRTAFSAAFCHYTCSTRKVNYDGNRAFCPRRLLRQRNLQPRHYNRPLE